MRVIFEVNVVHILASRQTICDTCVVAEKAIYSSFIADCLDVISVVIF